MRCAGSPRCCTGISVCELPAASHNHHLAPIETLSQGERLAVAPSPQWSTNPHCRRAFRLRWARAYGMTGAGRGGVS